MRVIITLFQLMPVSMLLLCLCMEATAFAKGNTVPEILYVNADKGRWQIFASDDKGSHAQQLTETDSDKRTPSWMANRKKVLFATRSGDIQILNVQDGQSSVVKLTTVSNGEPIWSESQQAFAYISYVNPREYISELWVGWKRKKDGRFHFESVRVPPGLLTSPSWAPDGKKIYYTRLEKVGDAGTIENICSFDFLSETEQILIHDGHDNTHSAISPDGTLLAYSSDKSGGYDIWIMDLKTLEKTRLTNSPGMDADPSWSPDGSKIAFVSSRTGKRQVWVVDIESVVQHQISFSKNGSQDPQWN